MICSICGTPGAPHLEKRPSGPNGEPEEWGFCIPCFMELQRQLTDRDPVICERYKVFLQFLSGRYRMQRTFNGNQASVILPEKKIDNGN